MTGYPPLSAGKRFILLTALLLIKCRTTAAAAAGSGRGYSEGGCDDGWWELRGASRGLMHYHQHKTGGISLNTIVVSRYRGEEIHGGKRPPLVQVLEFAARYNRSVVTLLREPVARALSRFFFWRATEHPGTPKGFKALCQSLSSYIVHDARHNNYYQVGFVWFAIMTRMWRAKRPAPRAHWGQCREVLYFFI